MNQMERKIKKGALFIPIVIGGVFLFGWIIMLLWNAILPDVSSLKPISFWQALGIFVLSKILFGFNKGWGGKPGWKNRMESKLKDMTPEEREKFKAEWKDRCNRWRGTSYSTVNKPQEDPGI